MSDPEKIASAEEAPTQIEKTEHDHVEEPFLEFTPEEEARVIRKLDYRLLPFLFLLYSLSVLDRSNLGNAKLAGLSKDIDIKGNRYNWLGTVFYIAYILSQWGLLGWKQFKPHNWVACVVFLWGFIATIQATVTGWGGLMVCRFFLAIAEAMYGPGVPLYFSYFYPREKIGFRIGCFISGSAMANAYGGALAYGISQAKTSIGAWRILFIVEGIPTCLIAIVAWFFLPDSLNSANFLNDREKAIAKAYVKRNQDADDEDHKVGVRPKELLAALKEPKNWIPPIMYFSCNVSFASLPLFVPTIISQMGKFTTIQSNGLSAPPYLLCFFTIIILSFLSDRLRVRGPFCFLASFVAAIGFILQATTKGVGTRYFGVFLSINIFASVALLLSWASNINRTETMRAGALAMMSTLGQCGPLLGTNVFPASEEPYYRKGMWISAAFCLVVSVLSIVLSVICYRENKQMERDGLIDAPGVQMADAPSGGGAVSRKYRQLW